MSALCGQVQSGDRYVVSGAVQGEGRAASRVGGPRHACCTPGLAESNEKSSFCRPTPLKLGQLSLVKHVTDSASGLGSEVGAIPPSH